MTRAGSLALAAAVLALSACTDPRARPVPPTVTITMEPHLPIVSPGPLLGSVYVYDANGIDSIVVRVDLGNGSSLGDSVFFPSGDPFVDTLDLHWQLPGGVPDHTTVKLLVRARSYIGFVGADSVLTAVGDTLR